MRVSAHLTFPTFNFIFTPPSLQTLQPLSINQSINRQLRLFILNPHALLIALNSQMDYGKLQAMAFYAEEVR